MACISTAGFHQGSSMNTLVATCRFRPSPPAFREIRITLTLSSSRKALSMACRIEMGSDPISMTVLIPARFSRQSTMCSMLAYWEKMMDLASGVSVLIRCSSSTSRSTLVLEANCSRLTFCRMLLRPTGLTMSFTGSGASNPSASGRRSTLTATKHTGHPMPPSGSCGAVSRYSTMQSRWKVCLQSDVTRTLGSTSSWQIPHTSLHPALRVGITGTGCTSPDSEASTFPS
mmetsp:Transcript_24318/g.43931  ORF Transcript_24318/g.43931 Transcript_24318/m.43931 type:complete len:230 (-) Transcript_24318:2807-3496(-)